MSEEEELDWEKLKSFTYDIIGPLLHQIELYYDLIDVIDELYELDPEDVAIITSKKFLRKNSELDQETESKIRHIALGKTFSKIELRENLQISKNGFAE